MAPSIPSVQSTEYSAGVSTPVGAWSGRVMAWPGDCDLQRRVDKHLQCATYADNIKHYRLCKRTKVEKSSTPGKDDQ